MEKFFGRNFLGEILWKNFFERNSLFTLLKSANLFEYGRIDLFVKILVCVKILSHGEEEGIRNLDP